ncbi:K+-dependent Na+/Ca+ exchanger related-protein [alpha proteobacterium BAL199]|jgi:cation:H+ antiporter|nr:K+-dependent Na+/Ca+ exchanger related-protein [alpha proteobacterium BAL199]
MTILLLLAGLVLLLVGGEVLVRGATAIAERLGMPHFVVGVVVVGFGTSMPELVTSVEAALVGAPGIAVGNIVGSNIANILLILGLSAMLAPIAVDRAVLRRDGVIALIAAVACLILAALDGIDRLTGALLVAGLVAYIYVTIRHPACADCPAADETVARPNILLALLLSGVGLVVLIWGADLLVTAAIALARTSGVSESVIGLTVVAIGTSLPELATSVIAAVRRQADIALGNILGSNIYNVLGILGTTALIKPVAIPDDIASTDVWVMVAATLLLLVFATTGRRICRLEGVSFVALYGGYIGWLTLA